MILLIPTDQKMTSLLHFFPPLSCFCFCSAALSRWGGGRDGLWIPVTAKCLWSWSSNIGDRPINGLSKKKFNNLAFIFYEFLASVYLWKIISGIACETIGIYLTCRFNNCACIIFNVILASNKSVVLLCQQIKSDNENLLILYSPFMISKNLDLMRFLCLSL